MKVSFTLNNGKKVRVYIYLPGYQDPIRITSTLKVSGWKDQRAVGASARLINDELDRIEDELKRWWYSSDVTRMSHGHILKSLERIIDNKVLDPVSSRLTIDDYFKDFLREKRLEINPKTKRPLSKGNIKSYERAFEILFDFNRDLEFEHFTKRMYHLFAEYMLQRYSVNYTGKVITRLTTFLSWADDCKLPVNNEYCFWKSMNEDSTEEERALNSEQLDKIYRLKVDPLEVYEIAKNVEGKTLDALQVEQMCKSIKEAANQAVAIASLGPHKEDFWKLDERNVVGDLIKYSRGKNNIQCITPFRDNHVFHAKELANLRGGKLFKRMTKINKYLRYVRILCDIPFKITASNFRKTFGSIIYFEFPNHPDVNKIAVLMKAYGHKKESTLRKYLGIQEDDLQKDHEKLFQY